MQKSPVSHYRRTSVLTIWATVCTLILYGNPSFSQAVSADTRATKVIATASPSLSLVVEDAAFGLAEGLVRELRNGSYVLYVRHGSLLPNTVDKLGPREWWKDCQNTKRIGPEVQAQMRVIADALSRQRIAVHELLSSEFCRAYDTAVLLGVAVPQRNAALNDFAAKSTSAQSSSALAAYTAGLYQLIAKPIPPRTNRVLVGHALPATVIHAALSTLPEGHTAIFKVEPGNRFHYITTLSPSQWQSIGKQSVSDTFTVIQSPPQVSAAVQPPANVTLIDATKELKGAVLLAALRTGGFNLYMRHALSNVGQDGNLIQVPNWWENCTIQRNIADTGREQARKIGAAMRELKIPVSQVLTAQFCRTRDTGHAMDLGPLEVTEDLNHQIGQRAGFDINAARFKQLAEAPARGTNRILVSHTHSSPRPQERIMGAIQEAEIVVYQPDNKGGSEPIARIPATEWDIFVRNAALAKQ